MKEKEEVKDKMNKSTKCLDIHISHPKKNPIHSKHLIRKGFKSE